MTVMRVHVSHLSDIPNFQTTIIGDCIELIVFPIKTNASDRIPMTHKSLNLLLVVNVPNSKDPVFPTAY